MDTTSFKQQIDEDIKLIQEDYVKNNPLLEKNEYAFNYWVLTKLFGVDEEVVEDNITEYSDDGCDCFVFYEESKELFIIQNKYYTTTKLDEGYVKKDFFYGPLPALEQGNYKRSKKLQEVFNKYKNDDGFKIYLNLYVTNNNVDDSLRTAFKEFNYPSNTIKCYIEFNLYCLDDIKNLYYEDRKEETKNFDCVFSTKNDGTVLNIDKEAYHLPSLIDAKYILTPVRRIYEIVDNAEKTNYPLFEENIREYLGNRGVNARMANTLEDDNDRDNFFYYNNGITVICDSVQKESLDGGIELARGFRAFNPQIVNGCQTVNTIHEVLKKYPESELSQKFENTFVMVKLLVLDKNNNENIKLYQDIVRYNNSQNAISDKDFAMNRRVFLSLQQEMKRRGLLLSVKQSDKNTFHVQESFSTYRPLIENYSEMFSLDFNRLDDIIVPIEKMMQVVLAFSGDGYQAFTKKAQLSKLGSPTYEFVIEQLKSDKMTNNDLVSLYMLFLKAEKDKKNSEDLRTPIPYYVLGFIGNEFKNCDDDEFRRKYGYLFSNKRVFETIYAFYKTITKRYKINFYKNRGIEYNQMIKTPIDTDILHDTINDEFDVMDNGEEKEIVKRFRSSFTE